MLTRIWKNWQTEGGAGQCKGCDAHWSIRDDYPGDPGSRTSSCGHRPFFGDGAIESVEVAIFGHEPGNDFDHEPDSDPDEFGPNYTQYTFAEARGKDVKEVPVGANSLEKTQQFFEILDEEFEVYWSQVKKCNELGDKQKNAAAENQCSEYLRDEIRAIDPSLVISLGKEPYSRFSDVFDIESLGANFARGIAAGERPSGFQSLSVNNESFTYIPIGHPSRGIHPQTKEKLDIPEGTSNFSEKYYELVAQDVVQYQEERD